MNKKVKETDNSVALSSNTTTNKKKTTITWFVFLVIVIIAALATFFLTRAFLINWPIEGSSMNDTILDGEMVLLFKTKNVSYDDIIVFDKNYGTESTSFYLIKRVIGLPGDIIESRYSSEDSCFHIYRNETMVDESCIKEPMNYAGGYSEFKVTIPENSYFVLGDNRNNSSDSHYGIYAQKDSIEGKAILLYHGTTKENGDFDISGIDWIG